MHERGAQVACASPSTLLDTPLIHNFICYSLRTSLSDSHLCCSRCSNTWWTLAITEHTIWIYYCLKYGFIKFSSNVLLSTVTDCSFQPFVFVQDSVRSQSEAEMQGAHCLLACLLQSNATLCVHKWEGVARREGKCNHTKHLHTPLLYLQLNFSRKRAISERAPSCFTSTCHKAVLNG